MTVGATTISQLRALANNVHVHIDLIASIHDKASIKNLKRKKNLKKMKAKRMKFLRTKKQNNAEGLQYAALFLCYSVENAFGGQDERSIFDELAGRA